MLNYKRLISTYLLAVCAVAAIAQTGTNSPYTRYGFGHLTDQSFGNSKAMGGISYGLRNGFQINASNPASYTAVDSLTFLFDAGMSLQNANFKEGNVQTNAKNSTFDYIAMQFRLNKRMALSAGFLPYSIVGYSTNKSNEIGKDEYNTPIQSLDSYTGDGSLQQIFVGLGYKVFENLSVGANISYLYGDITHSAAARFNNSDAYSSIRTHKFDISDYKLDLGVQYTKDFGKKHKLNLGAVYSYGHDLNGTGYKYTETYDSSGSTVQTQHADTIQNAFAIPHSFGIGATYVYDNRLTVGLDYTFQKWEEIKFFDQQNAFTNRSKISVGAEFIPSPISRNYLKRIQYRIGAYYSDPYTKVNNQEGAKEYGASFGFGFPIFGSRSILNISGQYVKVSPKFKGMLEENYLRVNIGLTFNERWFVKWRVR